VLRTNVPPFYLSRYLWAVRLPPQKLANVRELGGGWTKNPLIKVSLYVFHIFFTNDSR